MKTQEDSANIEDQNTPADQKFEGAEKPKLMAAAANAESGQDDGHNQEG